MKEIKINIEGCTEDVVKVMKHLEQGGFLTKKKMSSGINSEGMNTTATYEVMPEDGKDRSEDKTEAELFMPKKGEVCAFNCRDNNNPDIIFIATGEKYGGCSLSSFVSIELSYKLMHPYRICTEVSHFQEHCRQATEEEIRDAVYASTMDEFLPQLPLGLDTPLGESGMGLSEGQAQRLAIARAVLGGAPIMLLDECTSALDAETEQKVLLRLKALPDRTCIAVTHRPAAMELSDCLLEVSQKGIFLRRS